MSAGGQVNVIRAAEVLEEAERAVNERHDRQLAALGRYAGTAPVDPTNRYWPTVQALHDRRNSQMRALYAARSVIAGLQGRGRRPLPGMEWGKTRDILQRAHEKGGWRAEAADRERAKAERIAAARMTCPHCGHVGLEHHPYVRATRFEPECRAFVRCALCGLTRQV